MVVGWGTDRNRVPAIQAWGINNLAKAMASQRELSEKLTSRPTQSGDLRAAPGAAALACAEHRLVQRQNSSLRKPLLCGEPEPPRLKPACQGPVSRCVAATGWADLAGPWRFCGDAKGRATSAPYWGRRGEAPT